VSKSEKICGALEIKHSLNRGQTDALRLCMARRTIE